jgi:hypothetical protein
MHLHIETVIAAFAAQIQVMRNTMEDDVVRLCQTACGDAPQRQIAVAPDSAAALMATQFAQHFSVGSVSEGGEDEGMVTWRESVKRHSWPQAHEPKVDH